MKIFKGDNSLASLIWRNSLVGKFVTLTVVVVFTLMGISAYINYNSQRAALISKLETQTEMLGSFVTSIAPEALLSYDFDALNVYMEEINKGEDIVYAVIISADGDALTSYLEKRNSYIAAQLIDLRTVDVKKIVQKIKSNENILHRDFPIFYQKNMLGHFQIGVNKSRIEQASQAELVNQIILSVIFSIVLGIGIFIVFKIYTMSPIIQLGQAARRISEGHLDKNVEVKSGDELGQLGHAFNQMMTKLKTSIDEKDEAMRTVQELNQYLEERVARRTQELEAVNEKLEQLALHDSLTNLPNRFSIQDQLNTTLAEAKRESSCFTVIMMDLDRFKEINDTLGHDCGDQLLVEVGLRLRDVLRPSDFIGRLGGDEFAIILPETDENGAKLVTKKIQKILEPFFYVAEMGFTIAASFGIATFPKHGMTVSTILKSADVAMYNAKNRKLGYCVYNPGTDSNTPDRLSLMGELRQAIYENRLELYYQPKVDLKSSRIIGAEALIRWNHDERGFIPPDEFIPMAEQSGLIRPLTYWVIKSAIAQHEKWYQAGINIIVSVNLSMHNLHDADFISELEKMLKDTVVPNSSFEFEITESTIMSDPEYVVKVLDKLGSLNVSLAIDDFGTGYSSLSLLKKLPVHTLKIDKSFVMDMANDSDDKAIVHSIIEMAHTLGLDVIAEGVENGTVTKQLAELNCDQIQGYYISRPLPAAQVDPILKEITWVENPDPSSNVHKLR
ncbi:MAG: EAL domain-containing protein [Thioalkalispiraceae bacterium]|jgi:diguanylate cyclase (GGDEF)-like protein